VTLLRQHFQLSKVKSNKSFGWHFKILPLQLLNFIKVRFETHECWRYNFFLLLHSAHSKVHVLSSIPIVAHISR